MSEQECTGVIQNSPLRSFFGDGIVSVYLIFVTFTQKNGKLNIVVKVI